MLKGHGIICGAYSSVCITGPLWYLFKTKAGKNEIGSGKKNDGEKSPKKQKAENA